MTSVAPGGPIASSKVELLVWQRRRADGRNLALPIGFVAAAGLDRVSGAHRASPEPSYAAHTRDRLDAPIRSEGSLQRGGMNGG